MRTLLTSMYIDYPVENLFILYLLALRGKAKYHHKIHIISLCHEGMDK